MKKTILVILAFVSLQVIGQKKEDIVVEAKKMIEANNRLDFNAVMDYTYPVLFDFAPKEMMVDLMKESMNNEMMTITFQEDKDVKIDVSNIKIIKEGHYALISFPSKLIMTFNNPIPEEQTPLMIEGMKANMKAEKIEFIKAENALHVEMISQAIAIFDKYTDKTWKFMNYQEAQKEQLYEIIHQEVFEALGL